MKERNLAIEPICEFGGHVITTPFPFSAVLLAGGNSTRMGRDKAGVIFEGQPLWQRQMSTLRATGPEECFISGRLDGPYIGGPVEVIFDAKPDLGPLAGLAAALHRARSAYLLVLAVDLPAMTPEFLHHIVAASAALRKGVVPRINDHFEPLAAIYPRDCLPLVERALAGNDRSLRYILVEAIGAGIMAEYAVAEAERALFQNLNHRCEIPG